MSETQTNKLYSQLLAEDPDLRDIVEEFVEGLEERLREIKQAYESQDWDLLTTLAHRLKGAAGSYGYPDLSGVAANLEAEFRVHRGDQLNHLLTQFSACVEGAKAGLSETPQSE